LNAGLNVLEDLPNFNLKQTNTNTKKNFIDQNKNVNSLLLKQRNDKFINNFINTLDTSNSNNISLNNDNSFKNHIFENLDSNNNYFKKLSILEQKYENHKIIQNRINKDKIPKKVIKRSRSGSNDNSESLNNKGIVNSSVNISEKLRIPKSKSNAYIKSSSLNNSKSINNPNNNSTSKLEVSKTLSSIRR